MIDPPFAELVAASHFSFLRGTSHPAEMVRRAAKLGYAGIGIADRNTVAGVVRAYVPVRDAARAYAKAQEAKAQEAEVQEAEVQEAEVQEAEVQEAKLQEVKTQETSTQEISGHGETAHDAAHDDAGHDDTGHDVTALPFKLLVGARLAFTDGTPDIVAYPADRDGWGRLCRLLTVGNRRGLKGECLLTRDDLIADTSNLLLILMPPRDISACAETLAVLADAAPGALWLGATMPRGGADRRRLMALKAMAAAQDVPLIATSDALYATPEERPLQDVVTCIREGLKIASAGRILEANAERHLKAPEEMARLFRDVPEAIAETQHLLARSDFCLSQLKYDYPEEPVPPGKTAQHHLEDLVWRRVALRYPKGTPPKVDALLRQELAFIAEQDYARYFLTIHDIVRFADDRGILCQGRGSAANSVVCFILGITNVDPEQINVLFARFLSKERDEPPDIDVDFEHERREEVIQHIYARYGRERAGIAATVICYRPRSAIREVGKVFGLSEDVTAALASTVWGSHGDELPEGQVRQAGHQPLNPEIARAVHFANRLMGAPRHLSQHVGGFILTRGRLDETVPIGNAAMPERTFIEWDRDDIDVLGLMKVDVLALGMLTCIRKALALLKDEKGIEQSLSSIEPDDQEVYDMLCRGDSIGLFQVESRAQMSMLPRLKPRKFYDLVIQVAIVRPGPIQGNMVHPYLRRRAEKEAVVFPSPGPDYPQDELQQVLGDTLGVPLFQEQAMRLAIVAAAFTDDEANGLRRAMATFRHTGTINSFKTKMVEGMVRRGYERDFAERCFAQIEGFGSYGFPESHAAAFAHLVYISAWIKCYHPDVFACALLNSQPMGFYAPAQIVRDASEHGIEVRPADINASHWDNTLEPCEKGRHALRLGLRQLDGFQKAWAETLVRRRSLGFPDIEALARRTALPRRALEILADADACRSIGLDRREAAWAVRRLPDSQPLPLFAAADAAELAAEPDVHLPAMPLAEHVVTDYQTARLSLKAHPVHFLRPLYRREGLLSCDEVRQSRNGIWARTTGIVLVRQRPGKGNVVFMTIEDETGIANIVVWANLFARFRGEVMGARIIEVAGQIQRSEDDVVHVIARRLTDRSRDLSHLREGEGLQDEGAARRAVRTGGHPRNVRILPHSRDFH